MNGLPLREGLTPGDLITCRGCRSTALSALRMHFVPEVSMDEAERVLVALRQDARLVRPPCREGLSGRLSGWSIEEIHRPMTVPGSLGKTVLTTTKALRASDSLRVSWSERSDGVGQDSEGDPEGEPESLLRRIQGSGTRF